MIPPARVPPPIITAIRTGLLYCFTTPSLLLSRPLQYFQIRGNEKSLQDCLLSPISTIKIPVEYYPIPELQNSPLKLSKAT